MIDYNEDNSSAIVPSSDTILTLFMLEGMLEVDQEGV